MVPKIRFLSQGMHTSNTNDISFYIKTLLARLKFGESLKVYFKLRGHKGKENSMDFKVLK